ncbi:MAG: hypothetical protein NT147_02125 [Candidatus Aminicenantes bacterium]|nr:hypothetical protein [Candidatus Aminicenantes bacterium]
MKRAISIVFCLIGIVMVVVLSGNLSRAAAPASWKAVILPGGNLLGDAGRLDGSLGGYVYNDAENSVDVYATLSTINTGPKNYRTAFRMNVYFPEKVSFSGINLIPMSAGSVDTYPGFPNQNTLFTFINGPHPYDSQYLVIQFGFVGEWTLDRAKADWTKMGLGDSMPMRMSVLIEAKNLLGECGECILNNYHSIEINSFDAVLERTGTNDWTIHVDANLGPNPDEILPAFPYAWSSYEYVAERNCTCVEQKVRNKTYMTKVINYAAWGTGHIAFDIKFVTN